MASQWKKAPIAVNTKPVRFGLPGIVRGGLGIVSAKASEENGLPSYTITHLASGNSFGIYFETLRAAKRAAESILETMPFLANGDADRSGAYPFETRREIRAFIHSLPTR